MVPKAGIVEILTELQTARMQENALTIDSQLITISGILTLY